MAHAVEWYINNRVVLTTYKGELSTADLERINQKLSRMLAKSSNNDVHIITDLRQMGSFPNDVGKLQELLTTFEDDGWGTIVIVGVNALVRTIMPVIAGFFGLDVKTAKTVEDAFEALKEVDSTL